MFFSSVPNHFVLLPTLFWGEGAPPSLTLPLVTRIVFSANTGSFFRAHVFLRFLLLPAGVLLADTIAALRIALCLVCP